MTEFRRKGKLSLKTKRTPAAATSTIAVKPTMTSLLVSPQVQPTLAPTATVAAAVGAGEHQTQANPGDEEVLMLLAMDYPLEYPPLGLPSKN